MSVILNQDETENCRSNFRARGQTLLPVSQSNQAPAGTTATNSQLGPIWSLLHRAPWRIFSNWSTKSDRKSRTEEPKPGFVPAGGSWKESYLCVDKCWTNTMETNMSIIFSVDTMLDDSEFFCQARRVLSRAQGNWLQRLLSWRSYTRVNLSRVIMLFNRQASEAKANSSFTFSLTTATWLRSTSIQLRKPTTFAKAMSTLVGGHLSSTSTCALLQRLFCKGSGVHSLAADREPSSTGFRN